MSNDLKDCPFCGSKPVMKHIGNDHTKSRAVEVKCSNVECRIARTDKAFRHDHAWLTNVATEGWNRRPALATPPVASGALPDVTQALGNIPRFGMQSFMESDGDVSNQISIDPDGDYLLRDDVVELLRASAEAAVIKIDPTVQGMADCMDMVRQELIEAGVIGPGIAPMFVASAVMAKLASAAAPNAALVEAAVAAEREACAVICDEMQAHYSAYKDTALLNGDVELSNAASGEPRAAEFIAQAIRARAALAQAGAA